MYFLRLEKLNIFINIYLVEFESVLAHGLGQNPLLFLGLIQDLLDTETQIAVDNFLVFVLKLFKQRLLQILTFSNLFLLFDAL